jgi:hypothetical protein
MNLHRGRKCEIASKATRLTTRVGFGFPEVEPYHMISPAGPTQPGLVATP